MTADFHEYHIAGLKFGQSGSFSCSVSAFKDGLALARVALRLGAPFERGFAMTPKETSELAAALEKAAAKAKQIDLARTAPARKEMRR